jgi:hypothetical protein
MFEVAHLANGGITILKDQPDFTRGEFDMGVFSFLRHQLARGPCAPNDLAALSHFQLDIVNQRTCRDISEGQGIARFNIRRLAGDHLLSNPQLRRGEDISFFPISIVKQGNPS